MQAGDGRRCVEIVRQSLEKSGVGRDVGQRLGHFVPALQHLPAFLQALGREIDRLAIMGAQHVEAQHFARPVGQEIADGEEVAQALGHFLAFDLQEAVVHPHIGERMAVMGAFALGDFILVMGKLQVDAAAMDIEGLAQILPGHGAAFDMPTGAAAAPGRVPARRGRVRWLPQHEVHGVFLVGRHFHPRARDHLIQRTARQLAVVGLGRDIEQHMTVRGIGMARRDQLLDDGDHLSDMVGGARADIGRQVAQRRHVFLIDARGLFGQLPNRDAAFGGARVDLVVHVGDVAHIGDMALAIGVAQQAEQHVEHDHGPRIADMGEVVDRGAADIHPHVLRIDGRENVLGLGQGVEEAQGHRTARKRVKWFRQTEDAGY